MLYNTCFCTAGVDVILQLSNENGTTVLELKDCILGLLSDDDSIPAMTGSKSYVSYKNTFRFRVLCNVSHFCPFINVLFRISFLSS